MGEKRELGIKVDQERELAAFDWPELVGSNDIQDRSLMSRSTSQIHIQTYIIHSDDQTGSLQIASQAGASARYS